MELMDSLTLETYSWLSLFNVQTFLIFSVMETRELIVLEELWTLF